MWCWRVGQGAHRQGGLLVIPGLGTPSTSTHVAMPPVPSLLLSIQVLETSWPAGNGRATNTGLSWPRLFAPRLLTLLVGSGDAARGEARPRRVCRARLGASKSPSGWRFTLKKGKKSCLYFALTSITLENKAGVRARNKSLLKIYWVNALIFHGTWMRVGE